MINKTLASKSEARVTVEEFGGFDISAITFRHQN
jgi:hypothetical protein